MPAGARDENNNNNNNNVFSADTYPSPILIPWPHHTRRLYWQDMKSTVVVAMSRDIIRIHLEIFPFAPWELKTEHTPNPNIGRYCCVPVTISTRAFYILQYYYIIIIHGWSSRVRYRIYYCIYIISCANHKMAPFKCTYI